MSVEDNKQLVRRVVEEVMNAGRTEIISKLFVPGSYLAGAFEKKGREARASFPDLHMTIEAMLAEGDQVVVLLSGQGTQLGPFLGRPPSGQLVAMTLFMLFRIKDGRILTARFCDDRLGVMQQLGLLPAESE